MIRAIPSDIPGVAVHHTYYCDWCGHKDEFLYFYFCNKYHSEGVCPECYLLLYSKKACRLKMIQLKNQIKFLNRVRKEFGYINV